MKKASDSKLPDEYRILVCLSLTSRGTVVAAQSGRLAAALGAKPLFLHVGEENPHTREALSDIMRAGGIDADPSCMLVRSGKVHEVACRLAEEHDADLIISGALEREGVLEYYVGSTARRIARFARRSVLLLTAPSDAERPFRSVAARVDFNDDSKDALRYAVSFARRAGALTFHALHEYELPALRLGLDDSSDMREETEMQEMLEMETTSHLRSFIEDIDFSGIELRIACLHGKRGYESAEYARREHIDLLITAAPRRRLGLLDKLFQHDVEYALESLPCAFLLHRDQEEESR